MRRLRPPVNHKANVVTKMAFSVPGLRLIVVGGGKPFRAITGDEHHAITRERNKVKRENG